MKNKLPLKLINWYQEKTENQPHKCKYVPSCSNYAKGCYEKFNFFKASFLTLGRCLRCTPFFKPGYDPVPLTKEEKLKQQEEKSNEINEE